MAKGMTIGINAIVAGQAVVPICLEVGLHEIGLDLPVAVSTDGLVKGGIAIRMAVPAGKTGTFCTFLVRSQGIPRWCMRELNTLEIRQGRIHAMMVRVAVSA
jgi:hypothetical protein